MDNTQPENTPSIPQTPPAAQNPVVPPARVMPAEFDNDSSSKFKVISLIIGIVVVIGVAVMLAIFVIPHFLNNSSKEKVVLSVWGVWEDRSIYASTFQEFTKLHPNITISYEQQDIRNLGKYVDRLHTRIDNGTGPDIYSYHNSWGLQLKNYLLPFSSSVVSQSGIGSTFYQINDPLSVQKVGAYYGLPLGVDTLCLFVNNTMFKAASLEPPTNWDDLVADALHLTVKDEQSGVIETSGLAMGTYDNVSHASDIISMLFVQNGADFKNLADPATRGKAQEALKFYTFFARDDKKIWDNNMENSKLAFAKGKAAMYFGYSWDVLEMKAVNPNLDFTMVSVPRIAGGRNDTIASFWQYGISPKTKHSKEAFELIDFLAQKNSLEKIFTEQTKARGLGVAYPRSDMASLLSSNPYLSPVVKQASSAWSTPFSSDTYDDAMNQALNVYLGNAVRSIITNGTSVDSALDTLSQGVTQVLSKYGL